MYHILGTDFCCIDRRLSRSLFPSRSYFSCSALRKLIARQVKDGKLILALSDSVRKRLSLLALASTMPFNRWQPERPVGRNGDPDHPIPLRALSYVKDIRRTVQLHYYSELCPAFPRKIPSAGAPPTQIRVLPRSPAMSLRKPTSHFQLRKLKISVLTEDGSSVSMPRSPPGVFRQASASL